jgi:hypothetical protein
LSNVLIPSLMFASFLLGGVLVYSGAKGLATYMAEKAEREKRK